MSFKNIVLIFLLSYLFVNKSRGQIGGGESFSFLNIPSSPRTMALGGMNISLTGKDVNSIFNNPAQLDSSEHNTMGINFIPYFAGIKYSTLSYARTIGNGVWGAGIQYVNYGDFQQTDASGNVSGNFLANDFAVLVSHSRKQGNITFGGNLKFVGSTIEAYSSYAVMMDFGGVFKHPDLDISYAFAIRNIGLRIKSYTNSTGADLPVDVQMGMSFKPMYMPVRFSLTAHHLQKFNITYSDPTIVERDLNGNVIPSSASFTDKLARHLVFGAEFLLSRNFNLMLGYNHLMRQELSQKNIGGFSGFSVGFMVKTKVFDFSYSYSGYSPAGNLNSFGLVCDLKRIIR